MNQKILISKLFRNNPNAIFIGSLGTISNDMGDKGIKIRGAMGCVLGVALGYAMNTKKQVICLIGEGSLLMKLGSIATINKYKLKNLKIYILNNGKYASCGGQKNNCEDIFSSILQNLDPRTYKVIEVA